MSIAITWKTTDITDVVEFQDAMFSSSSGSIPGEMQLNVKDVGRTLNFRAGERLTLDIDGVRYWDGFILEATQAYPFSVINIEDAAQYARIWTLRGADVAYLFRRRFVFNQQDPTSGPFIAAANTTDYSWLQRLVTNWLTLGSDNLSYEFQHVGIPSPDQEGRIAEASTWETAMHLISAETGAVWGIRPDRTFYYLDDTTITAPFILSDQPDDATSFGYSNYSCLLDGTRLANDARIWGQDPKSGGRTYAEVKDSDSIALHGLWQNDDEVREYLTQAHAEAAAESVVYGSPQHLHGGKDDSVWVQCRVIQPGLVAGQKVRIINNVFGDDQILPIRKIQITFANKSQAIFDLTLTWDIDTPINFFDYPRLVITSPQIKIEIQPPQVCQDLIPAGNVMGDVIFSNWKVVTSDPMDGIASFGGNSMKLLARKRYWQLDSNINLQLTRGDGYDSTAPYIWAARNFEFPSSYNYAIRSSLTINGINSPGERRARFPYVFFGSTVGGQDLTMYPEVDFYLQINNFNFHVYSSSGTVPGIGAVPFGTNIFLDWVSDSGNGQPGMRISVGTLTNTLIDSGTDFALDPPSSLVDGNVGNLTLLLYAVLNGSSSRGPQTNFFDNNFALVTNISNPYDFNNYGYNQGQFYSPGPEDGVEADIFFSSILQLVGTSGFDLPDCPDFSDIPLPPGTTFCETPTLSTDPTYVSRTFFTTSNSFETGSTNVTVNGIEQRLYYDYNEVPPNGLNMHFVVEDGWDINVCYRVVGT